LETQRGKHLPSFSLSFCYLENLKVFEVVKVLTIFDIFFFFGKLHIFCIGLNCFERQISKDLQIYEIFKISTIFDIFLVWKFSDFFRWINTVWKHKETET
jgi:hypothetical protein